MTETDVLVSALVESGALTGVLTNEPDGRVRLTLMDALGITRSHVADSAAAAVRAAVRLLNDEGGRQ